MIKPTIGRKLLFWANGQKENTQPEDATVVFVHGDHRVNLAVNNHAGVPRGQVYVYLYQGIEGEARPTGEHCEWMPYQKGQAAKTEQLEQQLNNAR